MPQEKLRYAVILSGGEGLRMGGADKGALRLGGRRFVDIVIEALAPQAAHILISAPHDYETEFTCLPDRNDGPAGPAAGLWSALCWLEDNSPDTDGFLTAPVDGPFLPADLYEKLSTADACAVARDDAGVHPTYAYWRVDELKRVLKNAQAGEGLSLKTLAKETGAREIIFPGERYFRNINTPDELAAAEAAAVRRKA